MATALAPQYDTARWDKYRIRHRNRRPQKVCAWWLADEDGESRLCMLRQGHQGTCLPLPR